MQNEKLEFLYARRSTRQYTDEMPTDEQFENIFKAACRAPSAHAAYPCHFILIKDKATFAEIMKFHNRARALETAPAAIVVCADSELSPFGWMADGCAATMNILYAAQAQGLASCWHGVYPREQRVSEMQKLLGIPEHIIPCSMITVGYGKVKKNPQDRFDPASLHLNGKW